MSERGQILVNSMVKRPPGPLTEKIPGHWNALIPADEAQRQVLRHKIKKLLLLAKVYGLEKLPDEVMWPALALRLAEEHEPGFRVLERPPIERKRGRPENSSGNFLIYLEIERLRSRDASNGKRFILKQACAEFKKAMRTNQSGSNLSRTTLASIETGYYVGKKQFGSLSLSGLEEVARMISEYNPASAQLQNKKSSIF